MKGPTQEDITIVNIYAPSKSVHQNKERETHLSWLKGSISISQSEPNITKIGIKIF